MRAASYVRVSTEEQAREGYGLAAQEEAVRAYCRAQSWDLVEVYSDAGRSGRSMKGRDELIRLLDDAGSGRFERVVFWKLDRLGRNLRDLLEICHRLEVLGVGIVSVQEAIDTGTATGRMVRNVLGTLAEFEREIIVDRIKAGLAEKARQGELVGPLPLGYRRDDAGGGIVRDPVTAPLVREAFSRYAGGNYSLREMALWATGVGLRSVAGNALDRLSMRKILTNVAYMGQVAHHLRHGGGIVAKGKHPPIVDAALFTSVQEMLAGRRRRMPPARPFGRTPYPLSGVSICGPCGAPLLGTASTVLGKYRYTYYRCSTAQRRGREACRQPMVKTGTLEGQVAAYVGGMRLPAEYLGEIVAELRRRRRTAGTDPDKAARLRRELDRWHRLFALGEIDENRLRHETAPLKRVLVDLERPQEVLDVEQAAKYLQDVGLLWAESPRQLQREFVREVFQRIVVDGRELTAITPRPMYAPFFVLDRRERFGQPGPDFCSMAPRTGGRPELSSGSASSPPRIAAGGRLAGRRFFTPELMPQRPSPAHNGFEVRCRPSHGLPLRGF